MKKILIAIFMLSLATFSMAADEPFLDGFPFRIPYIINSSQLDNNVTQNMAFPVTITPDENNFWDNHPYGDTPNGIDFTNSEGDVTVFFDVENFDSVTRNATFWVLGSTDWSADLNGSGFIYFGGDFTDFSDGSSAYDASMQMIQHLDETSGTVTDAIGSNDSSSENFTSELVANCQVGKCMSFNGTDQNIVIPSVASNKLGSGDHSWSFWYFRDNRDTNGFILGKRVDRIIGTTGYNFIAPEQFDLNSIGYQTTDNLGTFGSIYPINRWTYIVATRTGNVYRMYADGLEQASSAQIASLSNNTDLTIATSGSFNENYDGFLDEIQLSSSRAFSDDEIFLKWISQISVPTQQFETDILFQPLIVLEDVLEEGPPLDFLAGFNARQEFTLNTSQFDTTVTEDHAILLHIDSNNVFWDVHQFGDSTNGIEFAGSDGQTTFDWEPEDFNSLTRDAWIWLQPTEDYSKDQNGTIFFYYGGANTDFSSGLANVFGSPYTAAYVYNEDQNATIQDVAFSAGNYDQIGGTVTQNVTANCRLNKCVSFNGTSDFIDVGGATGGGSLDFGMTPFTMAAWVNVPVGQSKIDDSGFQWIMGKGSDPIPQINSGWYMGVNQPNASADQNNTVLKSSTDPFAISDPQTPFNEWIFMVVTRDASSVLRIYWNGWQQNSSPTINSSNENNSDPFTFGASSDGNTFYGGLMDTAYINKSTAYSDAEIKLIFAGTLLEGETDLGNFGVDQGIPSSTFISPLIFPAVAPEIENELPTITIDFPNGGEIFDKVEDPTVDVNFTVQDPDNNSLLVDLNFSFTSDEGSGTIIINDINTNTLTCNDSDFSNPTVCTFEWDISGVANGLYFILGSITDGVSSDFDASDSVFAIVTAPPEIEIIHPNGGEQFDNTQVSTIDINFTIQSDTASSFLVDINFSTSNLQGTGTPIVVDENTMGGLITCADTNFLSPVLCTFSWNIDSVSDGDFFIITNTTNGGSPTFEASDATFEIFTLVSIGGTGQCVIDLQIELYIGQYLQINYSGFDDTGRFLDNATFNLFRDKELLIEEEPLILVNRDFLSFISDKKINDDPYTLVIKSGNCVTIEIVQTKFSFK